MYSRYTQELTLSYVIHSTMNNIKKETIIDRLDDMFVFAENNG